MLRLVLVLHVIVLYGIGLLNMVLHGSAMCNRALVIMESGLCQKFHHQAATVPGSDDFRDFVLSNSR